MGVCYWTAAAPLLAVGFAALMFLCVCSYKLGQRDRQTGDETFDPEDWQ